MWRGYGRDGGVVIVFDTKEFENCLNLESEYHKYNLLSLADVVYDGDKPKFDEEFGDFTSRFIELSLEFILNNTTDDMDEDFITQFLSASARYKHRAFSEENEVRVLAIPWEQRHFDLVKRGEKMGLRMCPVFEHNDASFLSLFDWEGAPKLPIKRVILGPHIDQKGRYSEAKDLLRYYKGIEINISETPFVW